MSTAHATSVSAAPHSRVRLSGQLAALGVERGGVLMVHASLSAVGTVDGGADTVAAALREVLGPEGTLVVPSFTPENSDTSPSTTPGSAASTSGSGRPSGRRCRRSTR